jgi:hypothetical protein
MFLHQKNRAPLVRARFDKGVYPAVIRIFREQLPYFGQTQG